MSCWLVVVQSGIKVKGNNHSTKVQSNYHIRGCWRGVEASRRFGTLGSAADAEPEGLEGADLALVLDLHLHHLLPLGPLWNFYGGIPTLIIFIKDLDDILILGSLWFLMQS